MDDAFWKFIDEVQWGWVVSGYVPMYLAIGRNLAVEEPPLATNCALMLIAIEANTPEIDQ